MKNKIKITCTGSRVISFESLRNFQGNLKSLEKPQFDKLKRSIEKHGFSFPVFVWGDNLILDGHQRLFVVGEMLKSGFSIDPVPVVDIEAKNEKEASEKLLILQGRYGKITEDGLYEFIHNFDLDIREIEKDLELPDIDMERFMAGYFGEESSIDGQNESEDFNLKYQVVIDCESEKHQGELMERLGKEGLTCRPLML